jgi:hypothetical protein
VLISFMLRKAFSSNLASPMPLVKISMQGNSPPGDISKSERLPCRFHPPPHVSRVSQRPPPGRAASLSLTLAHSCSPMLTYAHLRSHTLTNQSPLGRSTRPSGGPFLALATVAEMVSQDGVVRGSSPHRKISRRYI